MKKFAVAALAAAVLFSLVWVTGPARRARTPQALVEGLAGSDAVNCFAELNQNEDESVTAAIIAGTRHRRARVRSQCARLLGQRQDVELVSALTPLLADSDTGVSNSAARALVPLLDDEELLSLLRDSHLTPASQLVMAATLLRDPTTLTNTAFVDWLLDRSHSSETRRGAYQAIRARHSPCYGEKKLEKENLPAVLTARQRILVQARQDGFDPACEESVRCSALPLYATLRGSSAYSELLPVLKADSPQLREAALVAIGASKDERALALFTQIARDSAEMDSFRMVALAGLRARIQAGNQDAEIFKLFCQLAQDKQQATPVRAAAMGSLRVFRFDPEALAIARQGLSDKEPSVRQRAAIAVAALGDKNARLGERNALEPSLIQLKLALAVEGDAEARCALEGAVCTLQGRIASRGK
ncbi:MAG: hypothetical protein U0931_10940 [Vulcanimicrobiota bacterium]